MNAVKSLRLRAGMQQKEVALAVGVSRPTVSEWEHQKKDPTGERLKKLAKLFNVSTGVILAMEPIPSSVPETLDSDEARELWELREAVRRDPDRRVLFSLAKNGTAAQVRQMVSLLDAMKATNPEFYDGDDPA
ncbi:MAG: helix-turn-helix transcriptional regulator [Clostridia bacterium]|nr:helix-turn-helix transcriptional regulator [Clostridia bacterium]